MISLLTKPLRKNSNYLLKNPPPSNYEIFFLVRVIEGLFFIPPPPPNNYDLFFLLRTIDLFLFFFFFWGGGGGGWVIPKREKNPKILKTPNLTGCPLY